MKEFIRLHKFFCRQSQHYIMGTWFEYATLRARIAYIRGFPSAYVRFMWMSRRSLKESA